MGRCCYTSVNAENANPGERPKRKIRIVPALADRSLVNIFSDLSFSLTLGFLLTSILAIVPVWLLGAAKDSSQGALGMKLWEGVLAILCLLALVIWLMRFSDIDRKR